MTVGELTVFNGLLYFAIWEIQARGESEIDEDDLSRYKAIADSNFNQGVEEAEIIAIANYDHALALCLAVSPIRSMLNKTQLTVVGLLCAHHGRQRSSSGHYIGSCSSLCTAGLP